VNSDELTRRAALLRYYSHFVLDPDEMTDEQFCKAWGQLYYSLQQTGQIEG
jgi:hypothetical protein